jgi:TP901 family phage tail tape measure protein
MADPKIAVTVAAVDQASSTFSKINEAGTSMGGMATNLSAKFLLITQGISQAISMAKEFTAGAVAFDLAVTRSAVAMGETGENAVKLRRSIEALAESETGSIYTHEQTAAAFQAIADEGRGLEGTLNIVEQSMNLASITGQDLATTTKTIEDVMSAFNMSATDAAGVVDVLWNTQQKTGTQFDSMAGQLIQNGQLMTGMGMSIEEVTAMLGVLGDKGPNAINGLLTSYQQMAQGSTYAKKILDKYNLSVKDSAGDLRPMIDVLGDLSEAGATSGEILEAFGGRSSKALDALVQNLDVVKDTAETNFEATGIAAESAGQVIASDAAETMAFEASMTDLKKELAEGVLPVLTQLLETLKPLIQFLTDNTEVVYALVGAFVAYKVALVLYSAAQWAANVAAMGFPLTWMILGIVALVAALYLLYTHWDEVTASMGRAGEWLSKWIGTPIIEFITGIVDALSNLSFSWDTVTEAMWGIIEAVLGIMGVIAGFAEDIYGFGKDAAVKFMDGLKDGIGEKFDEVKQAVNDTLNLFGGVKDDMTTLGAENPFIAAAAAESSATGQNSTTNNSSSTTINNNYLVDGDDFMDIIERRLTDRAITDSRTR